MLYSAKHTETSGTIAKDESDAPATKEGLTSEPESLHRDEREGADAAETAAKGGTKHESPAENLNLNEGDAQHPNGERSDEQGILTRIKRQWTQSSDKVRSLRRNSKGAQNEAPPIAATTTTTTKDAPASSSDGRQPPSFTTLRINIVQSVKQPLPGAPSRTRSQKKEDDTYVAASAQSESQKEDGKDVSTSAASTDAAAAGRTNTDHSIKAFRRAKEGGLALGHAIKDKVWQLNEPSEAKKQHAKKTGEEASHHADDSMHASGVDPAQGASEQETSRLQKLRNRAASATAASIATSAAK